MSEDTCVRCDGTGKNSGGRRCGRCGGDGREVPPGSQGTGDADLGICPYCGLVANREPGRMCNHPGCVIAGYRLGSRTPRRMVPYFGPKTGGWDPDWLERVKPLVYVCAKKDSIARGLWRG